MKLLCFALAFGSLACGSCRGSSSGAERTPAPRPDPPPQVDELPERARYVGVNVARVSPSSQSYPFVDLVKGAEGWISAREDNPDDGRDVATDEHGWIRSLEPGQIARLVLIDAQHHPTGQIVVTYEGRGELEYVGRVSELERARGRDTFRLDSPDGLSIHIRNVDAADPIRNLAVFLPGGRCEGNDMQYCEDDEACEIGRCVMLHETPGQYFHPDFLKEMQPFSLLRFTDWQDTNRLRDLPDGEEGAPIVEYDEIPVYESAFWHPVPTRVMLDLTNRLEVDAWFSIPHTASDAYIEELAAILERRQSHRFKAYVEYSNEAWNDIFDQHPWLNARGCAEYGVASECGPAEAQVHGRTYFSARTVQIAEIMKRVVGEDRIVAVMGAQLGSGRDWWVEQLLKHEHDGRPAYERVDAVAVAPYFGGDVSRVFETDERGRYRVLAGVREAVRNDLDALATLPEGSVRYLAYAGGQHLQADDEASMQSVLDANRAPQMERLYDEYLSVWASVTDDAPFVHSVSSFVWNDNGAWGSREWQGQPLSDAPKHRALLRFIAR